MSAQVFALSSDAKGFFPFQSVNIFFSLISGFAECRR